MHICAEGVSGMAQVRANTRPHIHVYSIVMNVCTVCMHACAEVVSGMTPVRATLRPRIHLYSIIVYICILYVCILAKRE